MKDLRSVAPRATLLCRIDNDTRYTLPCSEETTPHNNEEERKAVVSKREWARYLSQLIAAAGVSKTEFAEILEVSKRSIERWAGGRSTPRRSVRPIIQEFAARIGFTEPIPDGEDNDMGPREALTRLRDGITRFLGDDPSQSSHQAPASEEVAKLAEKNRVFGMVRQTYATASACPEPDRTKCESNKEFQNQRRVYNQLWSTVKSMEPVCEVLVGPERAYVTLYIGIANHKLGCADEAKAAYQVVVSDACLPKLVRGDALNNLACLALPHDPEEAEKLLSAAELIAEGETMTAIWYTRMCVASLIESEVRFEKAAEAFKKLDPEWEITGSSTFNDLRRDPDLRWVRKTGFFSKMFPESRGGRDA